MQASTIGSASLDVSIRLVWRRIQIAGRHDGDAVTLESNAPNGARILPGPPEMISTVLPPVAWSSSCSHAVHLSALAVALGEGGRAVGGCCAEVQDGYEDQRSPRIG